MNKNCRLCFKVDSALPTWNEVYKSPHWTVRHRLQQVWKDIIASDLRSHLYHNKIRLKHGQVLFEQPVKITITNYAPRPIDAANIYTKCIDALNGIVIKDDGWKNVIAVECITRKAKKSFASILVEPIKECTIESEQEETNDEIST